MVSFACLQFPLGLKAYTRWQLSKDNLNETTETSLGNTVLCTLLHPPQATFFSYHKLSSAPQASDSL